MRFVSLNDLNKVNLEGYQLKIYDKYIFLKSDINQHLGILEVTETIEFKEFMYVTLFFKSSYSRFFHGFEVLAVYIGS